VTPAAAFRKVGLARVTAVPSRIRGTVEVDHLRAVLVATLA